MPEVIRILKDGYWDRTALIRSREGSLRVRKESKETDNPGPWAREALRNEISYLESIPEAARDYLPVLLLSWDEKTTGYEIPYYEDRPDLARLVVEESLGPDDAKEIQRQLAKAVLDGLHSVEQVDGAPFCDHLEEVLTESIEALAEESPFHEIVEAKSLVLNGQPLPGLRASHSRLQASGILNHLAEQSSVRLHGDLLLENMLWSPLLLIDPVSVTGLVMGHPLFDLVKHESYASGELYAIREELVTVCEHSKGSYSLEVPWGSDALRPFERMDLTTGFRKEYIGLHGEIAPCHYQLIDAYFSLVMARNTTGVHQFARVLKGCLCLARAGDENLNATL